MTYINSPAVTYEERYPPAVEQHSYDFSVPCIFCQEVYQVVVPAPELFAFRQGNHIQKAMPSVNADDRELLISGCCPACWDEMMGEK